jgi:hypothetical protein
VFVYDISSKTNPVLVAQIPTSGRARHVVFGAPRLLYVACDYGGLQIFDITQPTQARHLAAVPLADATYDVAAISNGAVVAAGSAGLQIVDMSDPITPLRLASIAPPTRNDRTFAVAFTDWNPYAIIGTSAGVTLADFTDPAHPDILTNLNVSQSPSSPSFGVRWLTADLPIRIAYFGGGGFVDWTSCGALANHYLFTGSNGRLTVTDVWRSPLDVGSIGDSHANGIAVSGNMIYSADAIGGLTTYEGFPAPRVRIVYPYTDVPVRSGQALDITWVAENTTNTAWQLNYYNEGSPIKLEGTLSANNVGVGQNSQWTLHTQLPDAISTTAGRISVVSADGRIEGSTTIMLEGQMKSSISLAASTASIT